MVSRHIHIRGLVQGIGFRPHVYRLATRYRLLGTVSNSRDGVHITVSGPAADIEAFIQDLESNPPRSAVITAFQVEATGSETFPDFSIIESDSTTETDLLLTPDLGLCENCAREMREPGNRRYAYAFTTCIHCGPRYSITQQLPYDRPNTVMQSFLQCPECLDEYHDPLNRRYYSQTNSCPTCGITLRLFKQNGELRSTNPEIIFATIARSLEAGEIIAVKGIGGYLLLCDARNARAIQLLRQRKRRPHKPLAVLFPTLEDARECVEINDAEAALLSDIRAPIVLCRQRENPRVKLATEALAPGLGTLGAMLPYAPVLLQISSVFPHAVVATSGNLHGSPIVYEDQAALDHLSEVADLILSNNREILVPQDDSVIRIAPQHHQPILLRRSRGWAPNFQPAHLPPARQNILAFGADLKSAFALHSKEKIFISQYLGNQEMYESQQAFGKSLQHLQNLLQFTPEIILADMHPAYASRLAAQKMAAEMNIPFHEIQHHEAHFAAVLAENDLLNCPEKILGIAWDGTGYGHDGRIWGMEFFEYNGYPFMQIIRTRPFAHISGDAMSREPRLAAFSLMHHIPDAARYLEPLFTADEFSFFSKAVRPDAGATFSHSAGRLFDAVACLLGYRGKMNYEGQAALWLENMATKAKPAQDFWTVNSSDEELNFDSLFSSLLQELSEGRAVEQLAFKFHLSLVMLIRYLTENRGYSKIAFSGGVFQNALLISLIHQHLNDFQLYFHQQLSPNDESISYGQIACRLIGEMNSPHSS